MHDVHSCRHLCSLTPSKKLIGMIFQMFKSKNKHGKNITALFKNSSIKGMNGHCCFGEEI